MGDRNTTIGLKESTKKELEPLKKESNAASWDEFIEDLVDANLDISIEEVDSHEVETHERVERTRATVVGVLEAVDEADMTDDVVDIIKELSKQDMLAQNQEIIDHLIQKSKEGESVNDVDRLLANVVMETEGKRGPEQSPAAAIAQGLFTQTEQAAAERTTTERDSTSQNATVSESEDEKSSPVFTGVEDDVADDE